MTDHFWPDDERAGDRFSGVSFLTAMAAVEEESWLGALADSGIASPTAGEPDLQALAEEVR